MTSANIFVVSDTHFGHNNMYKFVEADGFPVRRRADNSAMNTEEGDELMIENWNKTVRDQDIIYHCGDVYFGQGHVCLHRLRGRKRLLLGNHDDGKDERLHNAFQKVLLWRMLPELGVLLSHTPQHTSNMFKTKYNFHGHIHRKGNVSPVHLNVSVEVQDYTPKSIEDLLVQVKRNEQSWETRNKPAGKLAGFPI